MRTVGKWIHGLVGAAIGGGASAISVSLVDPETFNIETGLHKLGIVAAVSGLVAAAAYLKQAPLPPLPE